MGSPPNISDFSLQNLEKIPRKHFVIQGKLALMIGKGFFDIDKKFEQMDKKIDLGFEKVNGRLDKIENILLEKHEEDIKYLKERVGKLEEALAIE